MPDSETSQNVQNPIPARFPGRSDTCFYPHEFLKSHRVYSSASFTIGNHVEELVLVGSSTISGTGNELANYLLGNSANNTLYGLASNDTLNGGGGIDTLDGGEGNDTYVVDSTTDVIVDSSGTDSVQSTVSYSLASRAGIENLILVGSSAMSGTGNTQDNTITASIGDTTINGGSGSDTASYSNAASGVSVSLALTASQNTAGSGSDTLTSIENLAGSRYADTLAGSGASNHLFGDAGNDSVNGGAGNDTLDGGLGNDSLDGGAGTDTASYASAALGVTVKLSLTGAQNTLGAGTDILVSIENLIGSSLNDCLIGNSAANVLDGGQGSDRMYGGGGNDQYLVDATGDRVVEYQNAGTDLISSSISYNLSTTPGVENLTLTGTDDIDATGNNPNTAGNGENTLLGNSGDNFLSGLSGSDILRGNAGNDDLDGGLGSDVLRACESFARMTG